MRPPYGSGWVLGLEVWTGAAGARRHLHSMACVVFAKLDTQVAFLHALSDWGFGVPWLEFHGYLMSIDE